VAESQSSEQSSPPLQTSSPRSERIPLAALAVIAAAWLTGHLPDWRYPLGAVVAIAVPEIGMMLADRFLSSSPRHPRLNRRSQQ
jgi:hypothetical protein